MHLARILKRAVAVAFFIAVTLDGSEIDAACNLPMLSAPLIDLDGDIEIRWQITDCLPETLKTYTGTLLRGFVPSGSYAVQGVAVRFHDLGAGDAIGRLRASFLARDGTSESEWSLRAGFVWSLCYDSTGYPGSLAAPPRYWPLGDHDSLRGGGWFEDDPGWLVPDDGTDGFWLVGMWPEGTTDIVRLGTDDLPLTRSFMIGIGDHKLDYWVTMPGLGLLVEIEVTPDPKAAGAAVRVISDYGTNPLSRLPGDSLLSTDCLGSWLDTRVSSSEEVRYGLVTICDTTESDTVWTPVVRPPVRWEVNPDPGEVILPVQQAGQAQASVALSNASAAHLQLAVNEWFLHPDGVNLSPTMDVPQLSIILLSHNLPPVGSTILKIEAAPSLAPVGLYTGGVTVAISDPSEGSGFRLGVPIQVVVDQQTSVALADREDSSSDNEAWTLRADPNPFVAGTQITIIWNHALIPGPRSTSIGGERQIEPAAELTVYNVLGQLLLRRRCHLPGTVAGEATLKIDGTESWAAGVYFGRVEIAGTSKVIKLLRVR